MGSLGEDTDLSGEAALGEAEGLEDIPIRTVWLRAMGRLSIRIHPLPIHIPIDAIGRRS